MNKILIAIFIGMLSTWVIKSSVSFADFHNNESSQSQYYIDTSYEDTPFSPKSVYNFNGRYNPSAIEFVELDTVNHPKKLWLSKKIAITPPPKARYAKVCGNDSLVFVTYAESNSGWYIRSLLSTDYGNTWTESTFVHYLGYGTAGHPSILFNNDECYLSYSSSYTDSNIEEIHHRKQSVNPFQIGPIIIVDTTFNSNDGLSRPNLFNNFDTLYLSYYSRDNNERSISAKKSYDQGNSWIPFNDSIYPSSANGSQYIVKTDSVVSVIHQLGLGIATTHSFDGGNTWDESYFISADSGFAAQLPAASTNGVSDIHAVWYDFTGAPAGWGGWVFYRRSLDLGETWSSIKSLSTYPNAEDVEIWSDSSYVFAVWNDSRLGSEFKAGYLRVSHNRGDSWSQEYKIIDDTEHPWEMDIYVDGDNFYMVWKEQDPPEYIHTTYYTYGKWYVPGDIDDSGEIDIADLVSMVDWMFESGNEPYPLDVAQIDGNTSFDIADLVGLVEYMFNEGIPPIGGVPNTEL